MPGSREEEEGQALSSANFWDARYANGDGKQPTHEWFKSFDSLRPFFERHLFNTRSEDSRILHLGAGDSTVPQCLAQRGYRNQLCLDFSPVVVKLMGAQAPLGVEWKQGDVRDMRDVPDGSVDVAFDKGTMDAMIWGSPWDPPAEVRENTSKYVGEVFRVLKDDGVFLYVTFRQPHFIKPLVNGDGIWDLEMEVLREGESAFDYHAFILRKRKSSDHAT